MTEYVCGFAFSQNKMNVLLIEKDRPEWQAGKLNGVGGKVEQKDHLLMNGSDTSYPSSNAQYAMVREFKEEVGIETYPDDWELFAISEGTESRIYNFRTFTDEIYNFEQKESEVPIVIPAANVWIYEGVPNIAFLIPMALYTNEVFKIKCEIKGGTK